jgi:hypothetical protein
MRLKGLYRFIRAPEEHRDCVSVVKACSALLPFDCGLRPQLREENIVVKSKPLFSPSRELRDGFVPMYDRVFMIEPETSSESDPSQVANISQEDVRTVNAEMVRMQQAAAETIQADEVSLNQSAAGNVEANSVSAYQAALASVEAEEVLSQRSAIGHVEAEKASVSGYTGAVVANVAEVHYGLTGVVIGREVHLEGARTILLVGRNVRGNVTTVLDARSALIAGLTSGLFAGLMLLLGRMLFGRK